MLYKGVQYDCKSYLRGSIPSYPLKKQTSTIFLVYVLILPFF